MKEWLVVHKILLYINAVYFFITSATTREEFLARVTIAILCVGFLYLGEVIESKKN